MKYTWHMDDASIAYPFVQEGSLISIEFKVIDVELDKVVGITDDGSTVDIQSVSPLNLSCYVMQ